LYRIRAALEALPCFEVPTKRMVVPVLGPKNTKEPRGLPLSSLMNGQYFHASEWIFIHLCKSTKGPPNIKGKNWPLFVHPRNSTELDYTPLNSPPVFLSPFFSWMKKLNL
jgi:hypothetical protein